MKLNKEDFLNSELGSNLLECIESWDWALRGGVKTKPLADWCQAQWEVYQIMFRQIFHINYHSLEQTNVLEFAQKTKKIGL